MANRVFSDTKTTVLGIKIPEMLRDQFAIVAKNQGETAASLVRRFIQEYVSKYSEQPNDSW